MNNGGGEVNLWIVAAILFVIIVGILFLSAWVIYLTVRTIFRLIRQTFSTHRNTPEFSQHKQQAEGSSRYTPAPLPPPTRTHEIRPEYRALVASHNRPAMDVLTSNSTRQKALKYKYVKKSSVMTRSEEAFYRRLFSVVGHEFLIFPQIHLSSLFAHDKYYQNHKAALSSIQRKSVDYILCDTQLQTLCAIELDDKSHLQTERAERDQFVNQLFESTGMPLLRIPELNRYSDGELYRIICNAIKQSQ